MRVARRRAAVRLGPLGAAAALAVLSGCAALGGASSGASGDAAATPPATAASAASAVSAASAPPAYTVAIDAPDALRKMLDTYLDLSRFRQQPGADLDDSEIDRLIAAAPAQARSLLETEGYFDPDVVVRRDAADRRRILVTVVTGARAQVASVQLRFRGAVVEGANAGDAHAVSTMAAVRRTSRTMTAGTPFRDADWTRYKADLLTQMQNAGYLSAAWRETRADVDTAARSVSLHLMVDSGPLFRFGAINVQGLQRYPERIVRRVAQFKSGDPATEERLLDFQERLQKAGLFESASVEVGLDPAAAAATPVSVRVREQTLQNATVGVGISANTGPRTTLEHTHRQLFGQSAALTNKFEIGRDRRAWEGSVTSYPLPGYYRNMVSGSYEWLRSADDERTTWNARLGRSQDTTRFERLYYLEAVSSRVVTSQSDERAEALSANGYVVRRDLDSITLPTRGVTAAVLLGSGYARSNFADNGVFGRAWGRVDYYRPFWRVWHLQTRLEAGEVFARDSVGIPDTLLFRAGGDDSVRGYAYRTLGPVNDGIVVSGRVLLTGSVEVARPVVASLPSVWGAVFVDAGRAADSWRSYTPAWGYGFGVRWRSPIGALRADIAYGQEVHRFRFHLSVGVSL